MESKAREKRWALGQLLKAHREGARLTSKGRSFYIFGETAAKAQSPLSSLLVLGTLGSS